MASLGAMGRALLALAGWLMAVALVGCVGSVATPTPPAAEAAGAAAPLSSPPTAIARDSDQWVRQRLAAVARLYGVTPAGREVLAALDVRQMRGLPGYFGSFGFWGWTGLGEAKPTPVIHELGHAYWGSFPVAGHPQLSWEVLPERKRSLAMERYHQDAVKFLTQPPDHYEVFRQRLKNLPALSCDNLGDTLFHTVEADMVSMVGGDLGLVPPILRKYWDRFLRPGPFSTWNEAVRWYLGLPRQDRMLADRYLGFQHLDLRRYRLLKPTAGTSVEEEFTEVLEHEQFQRLWDFADQFDLLLGDNGESKSFSFWRGYLRGLQAVHRERGNFLPATGLARAAEITRALDFLKGLEGLTPRERAARLLPKLQEDPFVAHFLPALGNQTLLELFTARGDLLQEALLRGTAAFVERLEEFAPVVDRVIVAGRASPMDGAEELRRALGGVDLDDREETDLFLEMFLEADRELAGEIATALDKPTKRRLLQATPVLLRRLLDPAELAEALDITHRATPGQVAEGAALMVRHPSGNFRIDEPFLDEVYRVVVLRGEREPRRMLGVVARAPLPVERFLYRHPKAAVAVLASDMDITLDMVKRSDPTVLPPARFVYALIFADPAFAARVVERLDQEGERSMVLEALAHFAYDKMRTEANPDLPIALDKDGRFLEALLESQGTDWLQERLGAAVVLYRQRVGAGDVPVDFLDAYRATLEAVAEAMAPTPRRGLLEAIDSAFAAG